MATKKKFNASDWISAYMDYVLKNDQSPSSVYAFTSSVKRDESEFYEEFASFKALEAEVFRSLFHASMNTLNSSKEFESFDARNQLLSFYFTFFENLTANRSFILFLLKGQKEQLQIVNNLSGLRKEFKSFIRSLEIEDIDIPQEQIEKFKNKSIEETAWIQLLVTMKFWMDDTSKGFEKTDIFIEKAINTSFDLINVKPLKSLIDLGKFIVKEKIHWN